MANTWQGNFPHQNENKDGFERTSPVTAFPPNGYGVHDMIGNVWEWTTDFYSQKHDADAPKACCIPENPRGGPEAAKLRPAPARNQNSPPGHQRRLAPVRAGLMPPLPAGGAPCGAGRHIHEPCGFSMHQARCLMSKQRRVTLCLTAFWKTDRKIFEMGYGKRSLVGTRFCAALIGATTFMSLALSGPGSTPAPAQQATQQRPNILLLVSDDTGYGDLEPYGGGIGRGMPTPNIERLAQEGMSFFSFYAQPSCTPGRAAMQTGRFPNRSGLTTVAFQGQGGGLPAAEWTLASVLKTGGYKTYFTGKWHLGEADSRCRTRRATTR